MISQKITLFLVDGLPKGIRSATIDQWNGKVVAGPRNKINETIELFEKTGGGSCIYFLIGKSNEGGLPSVYIGESDQIVSRIKQHDKNKEWWEDAVIFFSPDGSLTTTGSKYLEAICIDGLQTAGRSILQNSTKPTTRQIPYEDLNGFQHFYENIVLLLPLLGYDIFVGKIHEKKIKGSIVLFLNRKSVKAEAFLREDGQIQVLKGSTAVSKITPSFEKHPYKSLREDLIKIGKLVREKEFYEFVDDYIFNSASAAGAVILGNSTNGTIEWKNENGKTLKEILS
ncbi:MAG: GIY-YIG nuclease family protein [Patescibacteria group bacterium]|nr:GIY-YIG nuclease family protein [Patescibacteria group bacterium]